MTLAIFWDTCFLTSDNQMRAFGLWWKAVMAARSSIGLGRYGWVDGTSIAAASASVRKRGTAATLRRKNTALQDSVKLAELVTTLCYYALLAWVEISAQVIFYGKGPLRCR